MIHNHDSVQFAGRLYSIQYVVNIFLVLFQSSSVGQSKSVHEIQIEFIVQSFKLNIINIAFISLTNLLSLDFAFIPKKPRVIPSPNQRRFYIFDILNLLRPQVEEVNNTCFASTSQPNYYDIERIRSLACSSIDTKVGHGLKIILNFLNNFITVFIVESV